MAVFALATVTGCDFLSRDRTPLDDSAAQAKPERLKTDVSIDDARQLARPVSETPGLSVNATNVLGDSETAQGMQPARGLNTKRLFSERLRDDDDRFDRLEQAVQSVRDEIDTMSPSITRLVAVEKDMQELIGQLQTLLGNNGQEELPYNALENNREVISQALGVSETGRAEEETPSPASSPQPRPAHVLALPPPRPATAPSPAPQVRERAPPPAVHASSVQTSPGSPSLTGIRMADAGGKTRLVLETGTKLSYTTDLDNGEKILTFFFDRGSAAIGGTSARSKLIKNVSVTPQQGGGFVVAATLVKAVKIIKEGTLPPAAGNPAWRIYVDLKE